MSDRVGRELMHRLIEYKDVTERTSNSAEHLRVSNRIGRFIAKRSNAPMELELLDRLALLARWQHNVYTDEFIAAHGEGEVGSRSVVLYDKICRHLVASEPVDTDPVARDYIATAEQSFHQAKGGN